MTQDLLTRLRDELATTDDAVERMRARVTESLTEEAPLPATPVIRRPRRRPFRIGVAMAGAAVVALVIALSPFDSTSERSVVPAPATARAALEQAAGAAGAASWSPLVDGEFHHTMTTSFTPEIPVRPGDPREKIDQMFAFGAPRSHEAWIDRAGHGFALDAMGGGGDPNAFPVVSAGGYGSGSTFRPGDSVQDQVDIEASLRGADSVRSTRSLPNNGAADSIWYRTSDGFDRRAHRTSGVQDALQFGMATYFQQRSWHATIEQVDAVNDSNDRDRAAAIDTLLDEQPDGFANAGSESGRPGQYGITVESRNEDQRIVRAIELLGSAPLSPAVRHDLFEWLSNRPTAKLEGADTDALGRSGTRVTFERVFDEVVPAHTVTLEQLRDQIERRSGIRPTGTFGGPASVDVAEDHQYRRFYVSILFNPDSGELLDHVMYVRVETTAQTPRLRQVGGGPGNPEQPKKWQVALSVDRQGLSDATLFGIRERSSSFSNVQTAACETTPAMCR
jgi:hypothetical protein